MFELVINDQLHQFNFGFGFLKEINKKAVQHIDNIEGASQNMGLRVAVSGLLDSDVETLVDVLFTASQGFNPRPTPGAIGAYIEKDSTDINKLFEDVLGFLRTSNCTMKIVVEIEQAVESEKAKQKARETLQKALDKAELEKAKAQTKAKT